MDYHEVGRSNYFHVKDRDKFLNFINIVGLEAVKSPKSADILGELYSVLAKEGWPDGYVIEEAIIDEKLEANDYPDSEFAACLQKHIVGDEVVVLFSSGNEGAILVTGSVCVIDGEDGPIHYADLDDLVHSIVKKNGLKKPTKITH